jgi:DNA-binding transcriptional LysR family regulator
MATVRQLEAFRAVIQYGTVTAAADALGLSQPSVSKAISLLEYSTGLTLFERRKRRLFPTAEAMTLYGEVDKMFLSLTRIDGMSHELRSLTTGQVNIVSSPVLGFNILPECISSFIKEHTNANISLHVHDAGVVVQWIIAQQADVGLSWHGIDHPAIDNDPLCDLEAVCAAPPGHRFEKLDVITPADLVGEAFLGFSRDTRTRHNIDTVFERQGVTVRSRVEAYMSESLCALVANGAGVSLVNPLSAAPLEKAGQLIIRPFVPAVIMPLRALRPKNRPRSMLCEAFIAHLLETLRHVFAERGVRGVIRS